MPYINFEFIEIDDGHVSATDEIGVQHQLPFHLFEPEDSKLGLETGDEFSIFLSEQYCDVNGVFK